MVTSTPGSRLAEKVAGGGQICPRNHGGGARRRARSRVNARLYHAIEKARKESVARDVIERAINKGAGIGDDKMNYEQVTFEGYAPHKVPVIVEVMTDNNNRTAPEIRVLFRKGQLGTSGSNKFLFDHVGLVEAHHPDPGRHGRGGDRSRGRRGRAPRPEENDDIPAGPRRPLHHRPRGRTPAAKWLAANGWTVVTSELGYLPNNFRH